VVVLPLGSGRNYVGLMDQAVKYFYLCTHIKHPTHNISSATTHMHIQNYIYLYCHILYFNNIHNSYILLACCEADGSWKEKKEKKTQRSGIKNKERTKVELAQGEG
jgi:hypothetical protein